MDDPAALWSAVLEKLSDRPSTAWLRYLELRRLEGDTAIVSILPGHREVRAVATPARLEPVAAVLTDLRGQRTRIDLQADAGAEPGSSGDGGGHGDAASSGAGASGDRPVSSFDRRAAMQLPLVRQAMTFFPDATVIDAREEDVKPTEVPEDDGSADKSQE